MNKEFMNFDWTEFSGYLQILQQFSWLQWMIFSIVVNAFLYLFSIGLYLFIDKTCRKSPLQASDHPVTKADFFISILTVICNCAVMLLGVFLWKKGWITLNSEAPVSQVFLEVLALVLLMDFCMYLFHYAAHIPFIYKILHSKHHEHVSTNYLSLFVLHPFETIGFGMMIMVLFMCYHFSLAAITIYLFVNLVWGTIGHLNREFFPASFDRFFVGTSKFHNLHHLDEHKNFGFYTSIWDRLFGTYKR